MDNITHSLVGVAATDLLVKALPFAKKEEKRFSYAVWIIAFVANSFPDLDYFLVFFLPFRRINWLLHHRGHTHTLAMAPLQAALILFGFWVLSRLLKWRWEKKEWGVFTGVALLGLVLHICLDSLNSYGVHPFWPFDNRWYFLDSLFIVEPYLWALFASLLYFAKENIFMRMGLLTIAVAALALSWFSGYVLWQASLLTTLLTALSFWIGYKKSERVRTVLIWTLTVSFVLGFYLVSENVKRITVQSIEKQSPGAVVHDVVRSPLPTNPFCWSIVTVESLGPVASYRLERGMVTPFPNWISQEDCMQMRIARAYQNAEKMTRVSSQLVWVGMRELSVETLRELNETHCGFSAFLQFSRAPVFQVEGEKLKLWDMRFELRGRNFTEEAQDLDWEKRPSCPFHAPWTPPRADLLRSNGT